MIVDNRICRIWTGAASWTLAAIFLFAGCAGTQKADDQSPTDREQGTESSAEGETEESAGSESQGKGDEEGSDAASVGGKRAHHYSFAHRVFPKLFFDRPEQLMMLMKTDKGEEALIEMWNRLGKQLDPEQRIEVEGFPVHVSRSKVDGSPRFLAIIELPPPKGPTEAYMIGLVVRPEGGQLRAQEGGPRPGTDYWYYTLERSVDLKTSSRDRPRTVLGGWKGQSHLNFGEGPAPEVDKFRKAIEQNLNAKTAADSGD